MLVDNHRPPDVLGRQMHWSRRSILDIDDIDPGADTLARPARRGMSCASEVIEDVVSTQLQALRASPGAIEHVTRALFGDDIVTRPCKVTGQRLLARGTRIPPAPGAERDRGSIVRNPSPCRVTPARGIGRPAARIQTGRNRHCRQRNDLTQRLLRRRFSLLAPQSTQQGRSAGSHRTEVARVVHAKPHQRGTRNREGDPTCAKLEEPPDTALASSPCAFGIRAFGSHFLGACPVRISIYGSLHLVKEAGDGPCRELEDEVQRLRIGRVTCPIEHVFSDQSLEEFGRQNLGHVPRIELETAAARSSGTMNAESPPTGECGTSLLQIESGLLEDVPSSPVEVGVGVVDDQMVSFVRQDRLRGNRIRQLVLSDDCPQEEQMKRVSTGPGPQVIPDGIVDVPRKKHIRVAEFLGGEPALQGRGLRSSYELCIDLVHQPCLHLGIRLSRTQLPDERQRTFPDPGETVNRRQLFDVRTDYLLCSP